LKEILVCRAKTTEQQHSRHAHLYRQIKTECRRERNNHAKEEEEEHAYSTGHAKSAADDTSNNTSAFFANFNTFCYIAASDYYCTEVTNKSPIRHGILSLRILLLSAIIEKRSVTQENDVNKGSGHLNPDVLLATNPYVAKSTDQQTTRICLNSLSV